LEIKLVNYDTEGPETDNIASFTIPDPDRQNPTKNTYCIGFQYLGGNPLNPKNWKYDHTNYWDDDTNQNGKPVPVTRKTLDKILSRHSISAESLLLIYLKSIFSK